MGAQSIANSNSGEYLCHAQRAILPISSLITTGSPRIKGPVTEHIKLLAASEEAFPPILVHQSTMRVIDGTHRIQAALLKNQEVIEATFFEGSDDDAFIAAVRANVTHGLPLSFTDREAAAARILISHPERSDRWIATIAGLSAGTVGSIRRRNQSDVPGRARTGKDGRARPLSTDEGREEAWSIISEHPEMSLRDVAKKAGISPGTVRDVRRRMHRGDAPTVHEPVSRSREHHDEECELSRDPDSGASSSTSAIESASLLQKLRNDPSLRYTESGRALLKSLESSPCSHNQWIHLVDTVPPHCAYLIIQLARTRAREWQEVAKQLSRRASSALLSSPQADNV
jgi:DNA-binding CsgD family transcriptional regulator